MKLDTRPPVNPVPADQFGTVLAELRRDVSGTQGQLRVVIDGQVSLVTKFDLLDSCVRSFVDPVSRRARIALILGGSALGGAFAGLLLELVVRLLAGGHPLIVLGG